MGSFEEGWRDASHRSVHVDHCNVCSASISLLSGYLCHYVYVTCKTSKNHGKKLLNSAGFRAKRRESEVCRGIRPETSARHPKQAKARQADSVLTVRGMFPVNHIISSVFETQIAHSL